MTTTVLARALTSGKRKEPQDDDMCPVLERFYRNLGVEVNHVAIHVYCGRYAIWGRKNHYRPIREIQWPVVLPHKLAFGLQEVSMSSFRKTFNHFPEPYYTPLWDTLATQPWASEYPATKYPHLHGTMLGYKIHGDCFRA